MHDLNYNLRDLKFDFKQNSLIYYILIGLYFVLAYIKLYIYIILSYIIKLRIKCQWAILCRIFIPIDIPRVAIVFGMVLSLLTDDNVYFIRLLGDRIINLPNYLPSAISSVVAGAVTRDTLFHFEQFSCTAQETQFLSGCKNRRD